MSDTEVSIESRLICELIGTFALTFIGAGSIMMGGDITTVALAHGVVLAVVVTATMNISGGHINPAVTISMMVVKKDRQQYWIEIHWSTTFGSKYRRLHSISTS